jgi:hypothetical protein
LPRARTQKTQRPPKIFFASFATLRDAIFQSKNLTYPYFRNSREQLHLKQIIEKAMFFNQIVGDGANLFIIIVAIVVGFVSALGFIDSKKTSKEQENNKDVPR